MTSLRLFTSESVTAGHPACPGATTHISTSVIRAPTSPLHPTAAKDEIEALTPSLR